MTEQVEIVPVHGPVSGTALPPGSKSITNRALILAALADGTSELTGVLDSQDTRVMTESLRRLGFDVRHEAATARAEITGRGGHLPNSHADLWLENSGTSIRFLTSLCCLGQGRYHLDGIARMRQRPIGDLVRSLRQLGAAIEFEDAGSDCPPLIVQADAGRLRGGQARIHGSISSQFLSSLLMVAPVCERPVDLKVEGDLVSRPYVEMTIRMMQSFGVTVEYPDDMSAFHVSPRPLLPTTYHVEPDASAASYFFGVAAITQGHVTVPGLSRGALQGDVGFVDALERMGCEVTWSADGITVQGRPLRGIEVDMNAISDTAQTLAVVAVFASGPTRIRNVGHMRHKETDRIAAVVAELTRAGIRADEHADGLTVYPGLPQPAEIRTYDDHRMAMSFSLLGLRAPGIRILDPQCTAKTYPNWFEDLRRLCGGAGQ